MSIIAHQLSKSFDGGKTYALRDVELSIAPGEFVAIIGLSGAGKSTFLRSINGTNVPTKGALTVLGHDLTHLNRKELVALRKQIGFIFQQFNLLKSLSAVQNVLTGRLAETSLWRSMTGIFSEEDVARAQAALDSVGLKGRYQEKVKNLSGGQQQRVAIARALVQDPSIILADEPMASLDPKLSEVVLDILAKINADRGITVLVNIHVLELARKYAKRAIAFRKGSVVFDGPIDSLSEQALADIYAIDDPHEPRETLQ